MEVEEFIEDLEGIIKETGKPLRLQQDKIIITIIITDKAERKIMEKSNNEIPIKTSEIKIGITSLLYCPLKVEYKKKYPELRSESLAIDDGFMFENMFIPYLEQAVIGKTIRREPTIYATIKDTTISGHPDLVIEDNEKITILEFKAPISIFPQNKDIELPEEEIIVDEDEIFKVSESYITQAKIQKKIAQLYYQKPVDSYLFIKSTADIKRKKKK
ncbi:MAG: hypothetical protein ACK4J2_08695 [Sulfurihydrogenibium azorense]|uniref:hypothetical protein n=1 Tax=Sulfurihydrogenibium azorense TaxID=309806 RepID=UPI00391B5BC6